MDVHLSEHGATTADKVHEREEFRELLADVQELPETQRTALLLREIDALSYEQIAEAMETTVPSVKSLLVRARVSLAEAAEARRLSCDEVRLELGEVAEGLRRRTTPPVRRHLRACERCTTLPHELRATNKALALVLPVGPLLLIKKLLLAHLGHSAGAGGGTAARARPPPARPRVPPRPARRRRAAASRPASARSRRRPPPAWRPPRSSRPARSRSSSASRTTRSRARRSSRRRRRLPPRRPSCTARRRACSVRSTRPPPRSARMRRPRRLPSRQPPRPRPMRPRAP